MHLRHKWQIRNHSQELDLEPHRNSTLTRAFRDRNFLISFLAPRNSRNFWVFKPQMSYGSVPSIIVVLSKMFCARHTAFVPVPHHQNTQIPQQNHTFCPLFSLRFQFPPQKCAQGRLSASGAATAAPNLPSPILHFRPVLTLSPPPQPFRGGPRSRLRGFAGAWVAR